MARYIDADALIAEYDRVHIGAPGGARKLMVDAPTADVVEVCRCENCKRCDFYYPAKPIDEEAIGTYFCKVWERYTSPTAFCSYGERKEK